VPSVNNPSQAATIASKFHSPAQRTCHILQTKILNRRIEEHGEPRKDNMTAPYVTWTISAWSRKSNHLGQYSWQIQWWRAGDTVVIEAPTYGRLPEISRNNVTIYSKRHSSTVEAPTYCFADSQTVVVMIYIHYALFAHACTLPMKVESVDRSTLTSIVCPRRISIPNGNSYRLAGAASPLSPYYQAAP